MNYRVHSAMITGLYIAAGAVATNVAPAAKTAVTNDSGSNVYVRVQLLTPADREYAVAVGSGITFIPEKYHYRSFKASDGGWARIPAGNFSSWSDFHQYADSGEDRIALRFETTPPLTRFTARVQISRTAGEDGLVRDLTEEHSGHILGLLIPAKLTNASQIATIRETIEERARRYGSLKFPGKRPRRMFVGTGCEYWGPFYEDLDLRDMELGILGHLGFNGLGLGATPGWMHAATNFGMDKAFTVRTRTTFRNSYRDMDTFVADREKKCQFMRDYLGRSVDTEKIAVFCLSDEPKAFGPGDLAGQDDAVNRFRAYLRQQGLTPETFGHARWEDVTMCTFTGREERTSRNRYDNPDKYKCGRALTGCEARASDDPAVRRQFYWSMRFAARLTGDYLQAARQVHEKYFPNALTMVNQNNPAVAGMLPLIPDMFDIGRRDLLSLQWAEDWTCVHYGFGVQACSYIVNLLRSSAKYNDQPIGMYNMVNKVGGNDADALRLKTYSILAGCPKYLYFYNYGPTFGQPIIDNWSHLPDMAAEVGRLVHEIGAVEDFIVDGKPEPSQAAVVWSKSDEIWYNPWTDPSGQYHVNQHFVYLALLHSGIQASFLDETDIETGWLDGYKALYLLRPVMERRAAAAIELWVRNGGVLWMSAGAGRFDEYHEPLDTFDKMLGVKRSNLRIEDFTDERKALSARALDVMRLNGRQNLPESDLTLYGSVEDAQITNNAGTEVAGVLTNGMPGVIVKRCGKGQVVYVAGLAGIAYFRAGNMTNLNAVTMLSSPEAPRKLIALGADLAGVDRPVQVSEPMVEARLIRSKHGLLIPLVNYTMKPIEKLTVKIAAVDTQTQSIESLSGTALTVGQGTNGAVLSLPIKLTDMILIRNKK